MAALSVGAGLAAFVLSQAILFDLVDAGKLNKKKWQSVLAACSAALGTAERRNIGSAVVVARQLLAGTLAAMNLKKGRR